jgi:hypothetical protein
MRIEGKRRYEVLSRDEHKCQICLKSFPTLELHHLIPLKQNGSDSPDNLISVCRKCHNLIELSRKGRKKTGVIPSSTIRIKEVTKSRMDSLILPKSNYDEIINMALDSLQDKVSVKTGG